MSEVKIRIRIKRGTSGQWLAENPVLGLGEIGWITDTGTWFCGDGSGTYTDFFDPSATRENVWRSEAELWAYVSSVVDPLALSITNLETGLAQEILDRATADTDLQNQIEVISDSLGAIPWSADHLSMTGNGYIAGDVVYYDKNLYLCKANNDSIIPTDPTYWTLLGKGRPFIERPADWNATDGNNQILNKPTIPAVIVESVTDDGLGGVMVDNTDPVNPVVAFKGVAVDGVTIGGDGTAFSPLYSLGADTFQVKASASDFSPAFLDQKIACTQDNSITITPLAPSGFEYIDIRVFWAPRVVFECKNTDSVTINFGDPVYVRGMVGATNVVEVGKADSSNPAKMPAVGIAWGNMAPNGMSGAVTSGLVTNITTDPIDGITPTPNQTLYVKPGGGLTTTKPTGTNLIQNVGKVGKVSGGSSGSIIVSSIMRSNDIPNIADKHIWIGNASGVPTAQQISGDATMANTGALTIANDAVTYAKMQNVSGQYKLLGRVSAGAGDVEEVTLSTDGTLASNVDSEVPSVKSTKTYADTKQATLVSGTNIKSINGNSLLGSGDLSVGVTDGDKGDISVSGSGSVWTIDNAVVTEAKQSLSDVTTNDVNTSRHGYVPKAPNDSNQFLNGTGAWSIPEGYTLHVQALTSSPADGQTIYFGQLPKAPVTAANTSKVYIPRDGTIKRVTIYCYSGTAGTAESWSLYVRKNNLTDTLIQTLAVATNERVFSNSALNIAVVAGDYIEIKGVQPTWATNPLTTIYGGYVYIE